ncbi:ferrochelatase [Deminuibacter soli]|uniref:Ferrochelatase n=1 Tax=Deminuibacter soli TaxID=2291815 RepID=A0A3E1NP71_9BACT|nr:ferrochelatase [Deminuibacter soli]RFM29729.1 ferrochelatase [Deminuibacter soli]
MAKRGIILMNLGSPDSTEVKDVRRYLNEFLMDGKVIDMPFLLRTLLVRGFIVPLRAPKSAEAYRSIWWPNGSPLIVLTEQLQQAIQPEFDEPVEIAMRYGNPTPQAAYENLLKKVPGLEEVILFPLYPHYAMSSYETAVEYMKEVHKKHNYAFKLTTIKPFYNNPDYIQALSESIRPYVAGNSYDKILFSYHGIPERHVQKTDMTGAHCLKVNDCCNVPSQAHTTCYRHQTMQTTKLTADRLNLPKEKVEQTFQSRLGRDQWLLPYTAQRLLELPKEGVKKLLVVCPAFVSDCLETLEEIAMQGKESFIEAGGEELTLIPCLNVDPLWVNAAVKWLKEYAEAGSKEMILA